jgi:predicted restriction endonuclease
VEYRELETPLAIRDVVSKLMPLLQAKYSPFNRNNTVNNGYLYGVSPRAGRFLLDQINADQLGVAIDVVEAGLEKSVENTTERKALVDSRLGQGQFRDALMRIWSRQCAVTGLDLPSVLRASHIKPWRDSDNRERLDPYNGLLLSPSYDAAFDAGLITFQSDGRVIFSQELSPARASILGISPHSRIGDLHQRHLQYLDFHRQNVFLG